VTTLRARLNEKIETTLRPLLLGKAEHICIIDAAGYPNVGDNAILLGQLNFIERNFPQARLSAYDTFSYAAGANRRIEEASAIIISGGGNFGDIWPYHQRLRTRILEQFPHKPIIQAPQSISFSSEAERDAMAALIARQSAFTLLVRDHKSLDFARRYFDCDVQLTPDMAFAMNPVAREPPTADYFCLLRTDKERLGDHNPILATLRATNGTIIVDDWLEAPRDAISALDRGLQWATRRKSRLMSRMNGAVTTARRRYAESRLRHGIALLSQGKVVITDRLHGHILSCLLDIPHFAFDSADGKISAFHEAWIAGTAGAELLETPEQLRERLSSHATEAVQ